MTWPGTWPGAITADCFTAARGRIGGGAAGLSGDQPSLGPGQQRLRRFLHGGLPARADRGQCVSDAAQGTGLCPPCGADVTRVCGAAPELFCCSEQTPICCGGSCLSCAGVCGALADQLSACEELAGQCFVEMGCIVGGIPKNDPDCFAACIAQENVCLTQAVNQYAPCLSQCPPC